VENRPTVVPCEVVNHRIHIPVLLHLGESCRLQLHLWNALRTRLNIDADEPAFHRHYVPGNGNCGVHSLLFAACSWYRALSVREMEDYVRRFRSQQMARFYDLEVHHMHFGEDAPDALGVADANYAATYRMLTRPDVTTSLAALTIVAAYLRLNVLLITYRNGHISVQRLASYHDDARMLQHYAMFTDSPVTSSTVCLFLYSAGNYGHFEPVSLNDQFDWLPHHGQHWTRELYVSLAQREWHWDARSEAALRPSGQVTEVAGSCGSSVRKPVDEAATAPASTALTLDSAAAEREDRQRRQDRVGHPTAVAGSSSSSVVDAASTTLTTDTATAEGASAPAVAASEVNDTVSGVHGPLEHLLLHNNGENEGGLNLLHATARSVRAAPVSIHVSGDISNDYTTSVASAFNYLYLLGPRSCATVGPPSQDCLKHALLQYDNR